ncbi:MAG: hypothetical protein V4733_03815 [Verrucomicrobiota bacterium]
MKSISRHIPFCLVAFSFCLTSCGFVKKAGSGTVAVMKKAGSATADGVATIIPGERIKVVDVREEDLRELPTGAEKIAALDHKRGLLAFRLPLFSGRGGGNVPVPKLPFNESNLTSESGEVDASLLPPLPQ